jgi:hypothetical protein
MQPKFIRILFAFALFALLGANIYAQTTKIDPVRLLTPSPTVSRLLVTNASGATAWQDAQTFFSAGTGVSLTGNTLAVTGLNQAQEEGSDLTARLRINFIGAGITASDNAGQSRTDVTLDAELNALAGLSGTGFPAMTGAGAFTNRTLQSGADASGLLATWTNAAGVAGDPSIAISTNAFAFKRAVRVIATTNQALSGIVTIDGVTLVAGDRVLCAGQTTASANGIYIAAAGAWARAGDADAAAEFEGQVIPVREGTGNANSTWTLTTSGSITLGTTSLTYARSNRAAQATAGTYGSATQVPVFVLNPDGTISSVTNTTITGQTISASGSAGTFAIDLSGGGGSVGIIQGSGVNISRSGNNITIAASASAPVISIARYEEISTNGQTTVTVTGFTPTTADTMVFVDGVHMDWGAGEDITVSGSVITFATALVASQKIVVKKITAS